MFFLKSKMKNKLQNISNKIISLQKNIDKIEDKLENIKLDKFEINIKFIYLYESKKRFQEEINQLKIQMEFVSQFC
jgi:hypothetical protein